MTAMRPGLPDPLIDLLGARWTMGAPVAGAAWFGGGDSVGFGLADGTIAIARARWDGAARLRPREGGGVELVPADGPAPPVMRVGVHDGPCLAVAADGQAGVLSAGRDGRLANVRADGEAETWVGFPGSPIGHIAAGLDGARACAAGQAVHRFGPCPGRLDLPDPVMAMAFDPAGQYLAIGHRDGITLWSDGDGGERVLRRNGTHRALCFSPDGRFLVSGTDDAAQAWRVADGADIPLGDYPSPPLSLSFSVPAALLATSGGPRVVCWRFGATDGAPHRSECGVASTVPVAAVACHPARALIAAGYANGAVLLCQPDGADIVFVRAAGGGAVTALAWSPDGAHLALGHAGGEIGVVGFPELLFRAVPAGAKAAP